MLGPAIMVTAAGCTIPSYHLPAGFSSTYQRQIYGMEPVPNDPPQLGMVAVETRRGIFYPTTVFHDSPTPAEMANRPVEPLLLEADPLTSKKTAQRSSSDES